jgi:tetratricopeptide (TPR) repeat protein
VTVREPPKFRLLVVGRLSGISRRHLKAAVAQAGGELASRPGSGVDLVGLAHRRASSTLHAAPPLDLPSGLPPDVTVLSELGLKRMLGMAPPVAAGERTLDRGDLVRASKLLSDVIDCLEAFDVLEPDGGTYSYRDMMIAREVKRLLDQGHSLATIVRASLALQRSHACLFGVRVAEAPWGEIVQETCEGLAGLDGQLALPLPHDAADADDLFERAEGAEACGDVVAAERLYRRLMELDRVDAAAPYNLGNVLDAQGRADQAVVAYYEALRRDPTFAEAWFNLGVMAERDGRMAQALAHYRAAVAARPVFADAVFNLALLLTEREAYDEALPLWNKLVALDPEAPEAARARRYALLCRQARGLSAHPLAAKPSW